MLKANRDCRYTPEQVTKQNQLTDEERLANVRRYLAARNPNAKLTSSDASKEKIIKAPNSMLTVQVPNLYAIVVRAPRRRRSRRPRATSSSRCGPASSRAPTR